MHWLPHTTRASTNPVHTERGFTLVEMLVYIAIVVLVAAASVAVLLSLSGTIQRYQAEQALLRSNISIAEQLLLDIRAASSVNTAASVLDDPAGVLVLNTPAGSITYQVVSGVLERQDGAGTVSLQNDRVDIEAAEFSVVASGRSEYIQLTLTSEAATRQSTSTREYTIGAVTRAAYD